MLFALQVGKRPEQDSARGPTWGVWGDSRTGAAHEDQGAGMSGVYPEVHGGVVQRPLRQPQHTLQPQSVTSSLSKT